LRGVEAVEVEVEVAAREADGANAGRINIVGLPDAAVRESGDRVTTAILASALNFVYGVHTVNLAPADLKKEGPSFDLPIALAMIACEQEEELSQARDLMIVGELALDGTLRPLLDRIDLHVEVPLIDYKQLSSNEQSEPSAMVRSRVSSCRSLQRDRFEGIPEVRTNSDMGPKVMRQHCVVSAECSLLLEQAMEQLNFSARAHDRILKVARTIADLAGAGELNSDHVLEAIQYRSLDRKLSFS